MKLNGFADQPGSGTGIGVDQEVSIAQDCARVRQAERTGKLLIRTHGDQVAPSLTQVVNILACVAVSAKLPRMTRS